MRNTLRAAVLAFILLPAAALAQLPNLSDQSVYGRLGSGSGSGPGQSIPFSTLGPFLGALPPGTSVINPGTNKFEMVLPPSTPTVTANAYTVLATDLYKELRFSNSGTNYTVTFPASTAIGLANGTRLQINNFDTTATATISAGSGTQVNGGSSASLGPARSSLWIYDTAGGTPNWRPTMNSLTSLLSSNNLTDVGSASTSRTNLGVAIGTNVEAWDTDLDCLAALAGTGILRRTGTGTCSNGTTVSLAEGGTGQTTAAAARASSGLNIDQMTAHGDSIYTILSTDRVVATSAAFTASRAWTLPAANSINAGQSIYVVDLVGGVSGTNTLVITRAGSDTINGGTTVTISAANGGYVLISDGSSKWSAQPFGGGAGGGLSSITPGGGLVSSITSNCAQSAITSSGTVSESKCVNAQTGTSYAIADTDRGKLITASNSAAQAYTIAQAGTASQFMGGWLANIKNITARTNTAGIVTITPTTSTINGAASYNIYPGQGATIVSDGTNYQAIPYWIAPPRIVAMEEQTAGTGTSNAFTSGSFQKVALTTKSCATGCVDEIGVTLSSSAITNLPAGTYHARASVPFANGTAGDCAIRLRDTTTPATLVVGYIQTSRSNNTVLCTLDGMFTISASKAVQLELFFDAGTFGSASMNDGEVNHFSMLVLERLVP